MAGGQHDFVFLVAWCLLPCLSGGQAWDEAQGEWEATNIISRYNFTTHTWSEAAQAGCGPSVKLKRAGAGVGSRLFVLPAGQAGAPSFNMLHCFDLESGCWSMRCVVLQQPAA